jgi:hypothetical protein
MTMKKRIKRYCILFLPALLLSLSVSPLKALGQVLPNPSDRMDRAAFAEARIDRLQQAAKTLRGLAMEPLPDTLSDAEKTKAMQYTRWLRDSSRKLDDLALRWQDALKNRGMVNSIVLSQRQMEEMNTSYNSKYTALQDELLDELSQYAMISYSMKSNYDTAQSSINNLR